jgi:hypothetical protein
MDSFSWKEFTATLNGTGNIMISFMPEKRFIIDEVLVLSKNETPPTKKGDVNGDGKVDIADIAAIIDFLAGDTTNVSSTSADVNGDGYVNVADIGAVIDIMAGKSQF